MRFLIMNYYYKNTILIKYDKVIKVLIFLPVYFTYEKCYEQYLPVQMF